ncbi:MULTISPECIES: DUF1150 family protein [Roseobacteraceae]|jgi:hypothetical protein|uniref:Uncharacterized protein n=1 Tax=Pseudosulfitobacter pseudonitzschiae TaxID=1402135 RepID=A0A221K2G9_9RHOB|nr:MULTISPECIES: DUF1150 family protein [Roseobacteraceae]ASM73188.1 hypothetical protein SULPSESMR1_02391 [Pseudosulfitobacter pseudonitzschiae]
METPFNSEPKSNIVYVKTIDVSDLPQDVQEQAEGLEHLYAVHDAQGTQIALVADRKMAFVLARQNDLAPQAVH